MRLLALLFLGLSACYACDCFEASVDSKRDHADVIFRGTIVELRKASKSIGGLAMLGKDTKQTVVFRVTRAWKGDVGETFEMPGIRETSACVGFVGSWMNVGEDLLVYASRVEGGIYITGICGGHKRIADATKDFQILGPGTPPKTSR